MSGVRVAIGRPGGVARAQWRLYVLNHVLSGEITAVEAATHLGLSARTLRRVLGDAGLPAVRTRGHVAIAAGGSG